MSCKGSLFLLQLWQVSEAVLMGQVWVFSLLLLSFADPTLAAEELCGFVVQDALFLLFVQGSHCCLCCVHFD